jgi:rhomboid protease GluP
LYILSGLCGSLASIWWYPNSISVEFTSGAMGFMGAILTLLTNAFPKAEKEYYDDWNLCWYKFTLGLTGGIDNAAHIGGLLSGALIE